MQWMGATGSAPMQQADPAVKVAPSGASEQGDVASMPLVTGVLSSWSSAMSPCWTTQFPLWPPWSLPLFLSPQEAS